MTNLSATMRDKRTIKKIIILSMNHLVEQQSNFKYFEIKFF
jgi:hypothetical protein